LKAKIKEDAESQFGAIKPKLLADVTEFLISSTNDLPSEFLKMVANCWRKNYHQKLKLNMQNLKEDCVFN
jgi:hypothetical protein